MNDIEVHNPPAEAPEESITRNLENMQKYFGDGGTTKILVVLYNQQDNPKTDFGYTYIQMGQRLWRSLLLEIGYLVEGYEAQVLDPIPTAVRMHSEPDAMEQRCAWLLTVESGRVAALQERLVQLVTRVPYGLQESALSVLRVSP